ncbi:MAG: hypothetical protein GF329_13500 [Candidatus Lokiarchaeota archaeon]|nr:hypothetical protein [Candidatus Lokiarchaeota archaeon]
MKGIDLAKYCQDLIESTKRNYWRLKKLSKKKLINDDILHLARKTKTSPVMVLRKRLKAMGYHNNQIKKMMNLDMNIEIPKDLREDIRSANKNDPVYSPRGIEYSHFLGTEGEAIIKQWLEYEGKKYKEDPGNDIVGLPDFLLEEKMRIYNMKVKWIESKCSYGNLTEQKNNRKQFTKFDKLYGKFGCIVYWLGYDKTKKMKKRFILTWEDMLKLTPTYLHTRIRNLVYEIPEEFEHLLYPTGI